MERSPAGRPRDPRVLERQLLPLRLDPPCAIEESRPYLEPKYRAYADWGLDKPMPKGESFSVPLDVLARDRFIVGTPDECRADIDRRVRLLGVRHFIFRFQWPGMPREDAMKQIRLLGREIVAPTRR